MALFGGLGAGKTTFVQGMLKGLGLQDNATSPSFVIINEYRIPGSIFGAAKDIPFYHCDLYRLEEGPDIEDLGMDELFGGDSITVVEWAEKLSEHLPAERVNIYFETVSENERRITVEDKRR